jgi:hypothetical protein
LPPRDPALWVGFKTTRGIEYIGRPDSARAMAVTYDNEWYLRAGKDADGVQLFRRPWFWERRYRKPVTERMNSLWR